MEPTLFDYEDDRAPAMLREGEYVIPARVLKAGPRWRQLLLELNGGDE